MKYSACSDVMRKISDIISQNSDLDGCDSAAFMRMAECCAVFPGFADVHVHLREPGFVYKETIKSGTKAAARGGYTAVCSMPNLSPVPDSRENLSVQLEAINNDAAVAVYPYGAITCGQMGQEIAALEEMAPYVAGFSDDGKGVQSPLIMEETMKRAKALGKIIVAHCEDASMLHGGYIHDGEYARAHGHRGICSESEWGPIKRDIELVKKTGCAYHVCHVSTRESVELIRMAKCSGLDITCETAPHYLLLDDSCLKDEGRFKMNPPIRSARDREALIEGLLDGTVDMIATDHAPHTEAEKAGGLESSLMGVVGIETAFPLLYTGLVKRNIISLESLIKLLCENPRKRFSIESDVGFSLWNLDEEYEINPIDFLSQGKSTPFSGEKVFGKCKMTVYGGKIVWSDILKEK